MSALELLAVVCAVLALGAAVALAIVCDRMLRTARHLQAVSAAFEAEATDAVDRLREAARQATEEVARIDELLDVAASISDRLDTATGATYRAIASPVIKSAAFASGTKRMARRLRGAEPVKKLESL